MFHCNKWLAECLLCCNLTIAFSCAVFFRPWFLSYGEIAHSNNAVALTAICSVKDQEMLIDLLTAPIVDVTNQFL